MSEHPTSVHLRSVNLNLLPILGGLLSYRSGREMMLTPLAHELVAPLQEVLARVEALVQPRSFTPSELDREFVVATADPVVMAIGGALFRHLQGHAPAASVRFVDLHHLVYDRLQAMELDLVVVPRGFLRREKVIEVAIYEEPFVCIARRDHPAIGKRLDQALYAKLPHVSFRADPLTTVSMESRLLGLEQKDVLKVSSFSLLPLIVEQTDAIALVQRRVAERFAATANIRIYDPPIPVPPLEVCMYWSHAHERDAAHEWFRTSIRSIAETL